MFIGSRASPVSLGYFRMALEPFLVNSPLLFSPTHFRTESADELIET
jgi:hypothetical protein